MITQYTSPLIPAAVAAGKFPKADEDKLTGLAGHWQTIGNQIAGDGGGVRDEHQERHQRRPHPARQPHEGADPHRTGGGSGTSSAASKTIAPATGGSATGSHGDIAAPTDSNAWTGDLAGYQDIGNTAAVIGTVPAKTDASIDSSSGTTQDTTGTHGPKHTDSAPGTQPTSVDTSLTSAPTGTDSLGSAHDLDSTFTNATGKNTGQNVANTLTPTSSPHGDHSQIAPGGMSSPVTTSGPRRCYDPSVPCCRRSSAAPTSCSPRCPWAWRPSTRRCCCRVRSTSCSQVRSRRSVGSDTLAFNRDAESIEVLRCTGLRGDDLVTPIEADVHLPAGTVPPPLVRHHKRPWIAGCTWTPVARRQHP